ncbi:hypothetical protein Q5P01_008932 [Channa striata]|uniref:Uncharacterized protein n=1 Tax=Channa striata TaxID=64152 RepID=A0AA88N7K2_CHASR|nr:hypothetical protein Q5P01_008932 [Channa striata]
MFMIIREPSAAGGNPAAMSAAPERTAKQVQAAIKKKVEKQKKKTNEQGGGAGDIQTATTQPARLQKSAQMTTAEDRASLDERLDEMLEGPHRREKEKENEEEPVDLLPIVDSVYGQSAYSLPSFLPATLDPFSLS